jgi:hypothetical protein
MKNATKQPVFTSSKDHNDSGSMNTQRINGLDKIIATGNMPPRPTNCLLHACACMKESKR